MELSEINEILLDAFSKQELERLVRFGLHEDLSAISDATNLKTQVFELTLWALRNRRLEDLVTNAKLINPDHEGVKRLHTTSPNTPTPTPFYKSHLNQQDLYTTVYGFDGNGGLRKLAESNQRNIRELSIVMYEYGDRLKRIEQMFYIGAVLLALVNISFIVGILIR